MADSSEVVTQHITNSSDLYRNNRTDSDDLIDSPNSIVITPIPNQQLLDQPNHVIDIPRASTQYSNTSSMTNSYSTDSIAITENNENVPEPSTNKLAVIGDGGAPLEPKLPRKAINKPQAPNRMSGGGINGVTDTKSIAYAVLPPLKQPRHHKSGETISAPSRSDSIMSCATIIHSRLIQRNSHAVYDITFDIDQYITHEYRVVLPLTSATMCYTHYQQQLKCIKVPERPTVYQINNLISKLFNRAKLNTESVIIGLIYIERLCTLRKIELCDRNWLPIVLTALLTASKVWDDVSVYNAEFAQICPIFSVAQINAMERNFLSGIQYNLYINSSEYANHYFTLRAMRRANDIKQSASKPCATKNTRSVSMLANSLPNASMVVN